MVAYQSLTVQQVIDKIFMRIGRHRLAENVDWSTLLRFINNAIKETMFATLPFKEWAYITSLPISHRTVLPETFIKPIRCIVSVRAGTPMREARRVDVIEYFSLTNFEAQNTWNLSTTLTPTYMLWGQPAGVGAQSRLSIYVAPNRDYITGAAAPPGTVYPPTDATQIVGWLDCYLQPADLTTGGDVIPIPYEYEDLVTLGALSRVYAKLGMNTQLLELHGQISEARKKIAAIHEAKEGTRARELTDFTAPQMPLAPEQPIKGEIEGKMF